MIQIIAISFIFLLFYGLVNLWGDDFSIKKESNYKILDIVAVFMLVLSTGGLLFVFNRNLSYGVFILLLIALLILGKKIKKKVFNPILLSLLTFLSLLILNFLFNQNQSINTYGFYSIMIFSCCLLFLHFSNNKNSNYFLECIYFSLQLIMLHALCNFFIYFFVKNNLSIIAMSDGERTYKTFENLFFFGGEKNDYGTFNLFGVECARNQGLFWEPGVLQFFLNMLFFLEAFVLKRKKYLLLLISFLIISTYSTIGIALLLIQSVVFILSEFKRNKTLAIILIIAAIPVYTVFNVNFNEKIIGEKSASSQKRIYDLVQPLEIAKNNPFFGIGLDANNFKNERNRFEVSRTKILGIEYKFDEGNEIVTNSVTFLIAALGFPTAILFLYLLVFKQSIIYNKKWLLILIVLFSASSEPLLLKPFMFIFIFSGLYAFFYKLTSHKNQLL